MQHKTHLKITALAILISLGATACGGSGGGNSPAKPVQIENTKISNAQKDTNTTHSNNKPTQSDTELNALKSQLNRLENQLAALTNNHTTNNDLASFVQKLATLQTEKTVLETQKAELEKERKRLGNIADQQEDRIVEMERVINEKEQALNEKEQALNEKESILVAHIEASNSKDQQIDELYNRINELQNEIWEKESELRGERERLYRSSYDAKYKAYYIQGLDLHTNPYQETEENKTIRLAREKAREQFVAPKFVHTEITNYNSDDTDYNERDSSYNFDVNITADGTERGGTIAIASNDSNSDYKKTVVSYNYNLEEAGHSITKTYTFGPPNGGSFESVQYSYGGNPTRPQYLTELEKLEGTVQYNGIVDATDSVEYFSDQYNYTYDAAASPKIILNADFANRSISGEVTGGLLPPITLEPTAITNDSGKIEFFGHASRVLEDRPSALRGVSRSSYQGVFMGTQAEQVSGYIYIDDQDRYVNDHNLGAVFTAKKQ